MSFNFKQNLSQSFIHRQSDRGSRIKLEFSVSICDKANKRLKNEKKSFEEQIWLMGKVIGTIKGNFNMSNIPIMQ